jgi:hypothetical protein
VFLAHALPLWRDTAETLMRLRQTEPACCEVAEYWRTVENVDPDPTQWTTGEALEDCVHYVGPGSLWLDITSCAARIHTGGRWRGFLSIEPLRHVHLAAFRSIAEALRSDTMVLSHDCTERVHQIFWSGATQSECVATIHAALGPPQRSVDAIDPRITAMTERTVPDVWYFEQVSRQGETRTG